MVKNRLSGIPAPHRNTPFPSFVASTGGSQRLRTRYRPVDGPTPPA